MSKVPPLEHLPFSNRRSISVREHRGLHSPHFRRSASSYAGSEQETAPVEIGSKGSIFSLVGRDTSVTQQGDGAKPLLDTSQYHVWHNRLWLVLPTASKKHNAAKQTSKSRNLQTVVESEQEDGVPTWKRVLQKLKAGYNNSKFKHIVKKKGGETLSNHGENCTVDKETKIRVGKTARRADFAGICNAEGDRKSPQCMPLQTKPPPEATIWERRNFVQINPLDFSHLHTSRLREVCARPQVALN